MEMFDLTPRRILHEANRPIEYVYFPEHGVVSLITRMNDGSTLEVATIGREGMVGLPIFLGTDSSPLEAFPQVEGRALRLKTSAFKQH
jgi:cyclic nucleotide-binding protein